MNQYQTIVSGAALAGAVVAASLCQADAQTFQSYRCTDGSRFIVGFYQYDSRAYLQVDGGALTLSRRPTLSGARYSAGGVTLKITKSGITLQHAHRPTTACELT